MRLAKNFDYLLLEEYGLQPDRSPIFFEKLVVVFMVRKDVFCKACEIGQIIAIVVVQLVSSRNRNVFSIAGSALDSRDDTTACHGSLAG